MYYSQTYKTKWHDVDEHGVMRPSRLLEYMQETANLQCREYGYDLDVLHREKGLAFILSRLQIRVHAPLRAYEDIEVRTWCQPALRMSFMRYFSVHNGDETVAEAISTWALVDIHTRALVKGSEFHGDFPMCDPIEEARVPRKVRIPAATPMEVVGERTIRYSDVDFNHHMNNTRYPDMVCDFLPDFTGMYVSGLSLSYMREAALGDTVTVARTAVPARENAYLLRTTRPDGAVCLEAEVELSPVPVHEKRKDSSPCKL